RLTDGVTQGAGHSWASQSVPTTPQQFSYSFVNKRMGRLDWLVLYNFSEAGSTYFSREIEFSTSLDGSTWSSIGTGILAPAEGPQFFDLKGTLARYVKITVKSGYASAYFELGEIEVYGLLLQENLLSATNGGRLESFTSQFD